VDRIDGSGRVPFSDSAKMFLRTAGAFLKISTRYRRCIFDHPTGLPARPLEEDRGCMRGCRPPASERANALSRGSVVCMTKFDSSFGAILLS
jgi:hypothetical protein